MRLGTAYAAGMAALALWLGALEATTFALQHAATVRLLSPPEEQIATWARWGVRFTDVGVFAASVTVMPLLAWAVVRLRPQLLGACEPRTVTAWVVVALVSWASFIAIPTHKVPYGWVLPALVWSGGLANTLAVCSGSAVQARLQIEGRSKVPPSCVLYGGILMQASFVFPGFIAGLVPVLESWREGRRRRTRG